MRKHGARSTLIISLTFNDMKAIQTKYLGATNCRPSRIKATAEGVSAVVYTVDELEDSGAGSLQSAHVLAAHAFAARYNWHLKLASGVLPSGDHCHVFVEA